MLPITSNFAKDSCIFNKDSRGIYQTAIKVYFLRCTHELGTCLVGIVRSIRRNDNLFVFHGQKTKYLSNKREN